MKAFIALAAVIAAVAAEADPQYFYGGYPYAAAGFYPYAYGYGLPLIDSECKNTYGFPVPCAAKSVEKRDAEAEADPQFFYGGYYGGYPYAAYGAYAYPYAAYAYTGCRNAAGAAVPCAYHNVAKRSADADPAYFVTPYLAQYGFPHAGFGNALIHTSRFGVCLNNEGEQVSC